MKSLQESMREAENKKRTLEEEVDALREECAKMKAAEKVHTLSSKEKAEEKAEANKMKEALEVQMDQLRDAHHKQGQKFINLATFDFIFKKVTKEMNNFVVCALRDEIAEKQSLINEVKDQNQKYSLAHQQLQQDYEKLKQEERDKSQKLQELMYVTIIF